MIEPRIAKFDEWWPIHVGPETKTFAKDEPSSWARFLGAPKFKLDYKSAQGDSYRIEDKRALDEIHRLVQFRTCAICRKSMVQVSEIDDETLLLCLDCGYWGGRGFRDHNSHLMAVPLRGAVGRYTPLSSLDAAETEYLVSHLRRFPSDLPKISPRRAERFVVDLLADYLDCEVAPLGGTKDGGVDGFIVRGGKVRTLIQVKWRQDNSKAEAVSVVREVAGTLLARGIPEGILVSSRKQFSVAAKKEAALISRRTEKSMGAISLSLFDYHKILDMLEISNSKLTERMTAESLWEMHDENCVFDGAAAIPERMIKSLRD